MSGRRCEKSRCSWLDEPALKSQCPNVKLGEWKIRPRQPGSFSMTDIHCVTRIGILISFRSSITFVLHSLIVRWSAPPSRYVTSERASLRVDGRIWSTGEVSAHVRQRDKGQKEGWVIPDRELLPEHD